MFKRKDKKKTSLEFEKRPGLAESFKNGDIFTKLSAVVMGLGCIKRKQIARGVIFFAFEIMFILYMILSGSYWISMLPSLGKVGPSTVYNEIYDQYVVSYGDNSFQILLYGILTIFLIVAFCISWGMNIKLSYDAELKLKRGKKINGFKDDLRSLLDEGFYKTLLTLPIVGITVFTFMPLVFMVLVAFTGYDGSHDGYANNLFHWVGFENFKTMFSSSGGNYFGTFIGILIWTIVWAIFATFTNYFLGIIVALMINKKGIKFKKMWRTILVLTIAIPQFISLLYVSKMFSTSGIVNGLLVNKLHWIEKPYDFWGAKLVSFSIFGKSITIWTAQLMVILINLWVGIPYLVLIATGILMNIPSDLYEASRIDGASPVQQFRYITMPYMLFVTAPYLLTSFTGNINNMNVIYLLTGGGPTNTEASSAAGAVGHTDLLITWVFKITQGTESLYYMASVIGIVIFIILAALTLGVYNRLGSNKNEGDMA
ncbi:MAG: sugar ABC transporter permease [Lachnospiraceae bacterium]|nr:sugar ABC transporter permease [Lachnospiraceae bacterium]